MQDVAQQILQALAEVRAIDVDQLEQEARTTGDLEIDSKEAEVVIAYLEERYERELAKPEDLEPEEVTSLASLASLIARQVAEEEEE